MGLFGSLQVPTSLADQHHAAAKVKRYIVIIPSYNAKRHIILPSYHCSYSFLNEGAIKPEFNLFVIAE